MNKTLDEPTRDSGFGELHDLNQSIQNLKKQKYVSLMEDVELSTQAEDLSLIDRSNTL